MGRFLPIVLLLASCGQRGDSCDPDDRIETCAPGLVCRDGVCECSSGEPVLELGAECIDVGCKTCVTGLACNLAANECQRLYSQPEGAPCQLGDECLEGLVCNGHVYVQECQQPGSVGEGGYCQVPENCAPGLRCTNWTLPSICAPPGDMGVGCAADADCQPGLVCNDLGENSCLPPGEVGDHCGYDNDCRDGLVCVEQPAGRVCAVP